MNVNSTAKRYAKALFEIAKKKDRLKEIIDEFQSFLFLLEENTDLQFLLKLPNVFKREKLLADLLQQRFSEVFINFLLVTLRNKRYYLLQQIFEDLQTRYDLDNNRIRAQAITAIPLTEEKLSELSQKINNYFNANVRIENKVDSSIIGGIIIRLNGQIFNASLTEQFRRLKQFLLKR